MKITFSCSHTHILHHLCYILSGTQNQGIMIKQAKIMFDFNPTAKMQRMLHCQYKWYYGDAACLIHHSNKMNVAGNCHEEVDK